MTPQEAAIASLRHWSHVLLWISIVLPSLGAAAAGARYYVERKEKKLSSGLAATTIQEAMSRATVASEEARRAKEAQEALSAELIKSQKELSRLGAETLQLQARARPRAIAVVGLDRFRDLLGPYVGQKLTIEVIGGNAEAMSLARVLFDQFRAAGIRVPAPPGSIITPDTWHGIVVAAPESAPHELGPAIVQALDALGIHARNEAGYGGTVTIRVGERE